MAEILQLIDEIQAEHKSLTDELEQTSKEIDKLDRNTAAILNDIRSANEHNVLIKAEISELRQESQKLRSREECMKVVQDNLMLEIDKATTATAQHRSEMQRGMKSFISASRPLQDRVKKSCSFENNAQNNLSVRRSPHEHERTLGLATAQTSSLSAAEAEISRLCADLRTQHSLRRGSSKTSSFSDAEIAEMREEVCSNNNKLKAVRLRIKQLSTEFGNLSSC